MHNTNVLHILVLTQNLQSHSRATTQSSTNQQHLTEISGQYKTTPMQWFRIVICHTLLPETSSSPAEWDLFSSAVTGHTPALQTLQTKLGYTCIHLLPLPWWSLFARRRINQHRVKLSEFDSMIFVSSQGFWQTSVLHHPKKRFDITLPLVSFKLRTHKESPNCKQTSLISSIPSVKIAPVSPWPTALDATSTMKQSALLCYQSPLNHKVAQTFQTPFSHIQGPRTFN